ncbi:hypothetical protein [Aliivibrio fischeri]|uniref:Cap15 family cyclic dinucleotide receptor domain-containing protein n=1 Tax=Aliivibrio fischeri TaxID=668 RepID=UPI0012DA85D0|nr:hypothetical protein [Aliivibrio fischeri]MUL17318.1 hypothetical protein [Aliivibrio fischeri]
MISLLPLTKMFSLFTVLSLIIVSGLSYLLSLVGIDTYSDLRLLGIIGFALEFLLIFLFTKGWRTFWKYIPALNQWIFPDLNGEWDANIEWTWKNGADIKTGTKKGCVVIKQSLLKFSVDLITDESESSTLVVKPYKEAESDQPAFYYMYKSESKEPDSEGSSEHKGAAVLKVPHGTLNTLSGNYFTNRSTYGRYTFERKI